MSDKNHRVVVRFRPEFLVHLLARGEHHYLVTEGFPPGKAQVCCSEVELDTGSIGILVEHESLPAVKEYDPYPRLDAAFHELHYETWGGFESAGPAEVIGLPDGGALIRRGPLNIVFTQTELIVLEQTIRSIKRARQDASASTTEAP